MRWLYHMLAMLLVVTSAHAQSFNCNYAAKPSELAICQDGNLGMLDEIMASRYFYLQNNLPMYNAERIRFDQLVWLRQRDACGYDIACIGSSYNFRIMDLCGWQEGNPYLEPCR